MTLSIIQKDINNEIVLLRRYVRQARTCIINKLVREAKRLCNNQGNEKQLEKNRNKADKLLREVFALKHIKDDEISKFGIFNFNDLQNILQNPCTDNRTKALIKVVRYKFLNGKIIEFKKKFPNYNEYICEKQKKHLTKKKHGSSNEFTEENPKQSSDNENDTKVRECMKSSGKLNNVNDLSIDVSPDVMEQQNMKTDEIKNKLPQKLSQNKPEKNKLNKQQSKEDKKSSTSSWNICDTYNNQNLKSAVKVISKEAAVKRFTDILQETSAEKTNDNCTENNDNLQLFKKSIAIGESVDEFFLSSNDVKTNSNITVISHETIVNRMPNINNSTYKALRIRNRRSKFNSDETKTKNSKNRKINGKDIFCDLDSIKAMNNMCSKRNKTVAQIEGNSTQGNLKIANIENEKLHPSWIARKKQQEIMKQGFQGKKIRFDEI